MVIRLLPNWVNFNQLRVVHRFMSRDDNEHECGKCGETFASEEELQSHARDKHGMNG